MTKSVMEEVLEKAGGPRALRESLGVSKQTISDWRRDGQVSIKRAPAIERITGIAAERLAPQGNWVRIPDADWPHPSGRPVADTQAEAA